MIKAQSNKWMHWIQVMCVSLLLIAVAVTIGLFLGKVVISSNWQDAIRLAGLGGVLTMILMNPATGMMLWIILEPFTKFWYLSVRLPTGIPDLSLARLSMGTLAIVWAAQLAIGKRRMRRLSMAEISIIIFCLAAIPSVLSSVSGFNRSAQLLLDRFITPYLVFVLAKNLYDDKNGLNRLVAMLTVVGLYLSAMVIFEQVTGQPVFYLLGRTTTYSRSLRKIVSLLGNPAFLGTVLGMVVPIVLYKFVRARSSNSRLFFGALFALTMLGAILCYNRGAWLALAAALALMLLFEREYRRVLMPLILVVALVGALRWQMITSSPLVTERLTNVSGVTFRVTMLTASIKMIREHPIFGVGFDSFGYYYLLYGGHWETLAYDVPTPHNSYIQVLTTMGAVAFIPYVLVFLSILWNVLLALRRARYDKSIDPALLVAGGAVVIVYMVSAAAVDLFVTPFVTLICFACAGTLMGYVSQHNSRNNPPSENPSDSAMTEA